MKRQDRAAVMLIAAQLLALAGLVALIVLGLFEF